MRKIHVFILVFILLGLLSGCSREDNSQVEKQQDRITVFAAASLTESFTEIGKEFEKQEGVKVDFNFAGSQTLKTSLENGVKADIFASASINYMDDLKNKGLVNAYEIFVKNRLILIKNKSSKFPVGDLKDLSAKGLSIAVGDKNVPVGMYWSKLLGGALEDGIITNKEKEEIEKNIKTKELNVKDVVSKVLLGEVDVGAVYATDVTESNSSKVDAIDIPPSEKYITSYPIAILKDSAKKAPVKKFYEFVLSKTGKNILGKYKFITY